MVHHLVITILASITQCLDIGNIKIITYTCIRKPTQTHRHTHTHHHTHTHSIINRFLSRLVLQNKYWRYIPLINGTVKKRNRQIKFNISFFMCVCVWCVCFFILVQHSLQFLGMLVHLGKRLFPPLYSICWYTKFYLIILWHIEYIYLLPLKFKN